MMLATFLLGPWSSLWFAGNTLDSMALLLCSSLGIAIAFRGGLFNLGMEGQIYAGGLAAAATLLALPPGAPAFAALTLAACAALLTGALMGGLCAFLKKTSGANELITSYLLSVALSPVADYLIAGPLRDGSGNLLATRRFAAALPRILPPSNLSVSFIFSLCLAFAFYVFLHKTAAGYRFALAGKAPDFARYGGIDAERYWIPALSLSGSAGGLCGFFAVAGTYGVCHQGFSGGIGWDAIAVALIARNGSLSLIPAALFYAALKSGIAAVLLNAGIDFKSSSLIQALILFLAGIRFWRIKHDR
jgi:simple sugar transport system permease protein